MVAKVEGFCAQKFGKSIAVDSGKRACINCIWYEQYFRQNRGNIRAWVATSCGYCLLRDEQRGPLRQPCKDYETEKDPRQR